MGVVEHSSFRPHIGIMAATDSPPLHWIDIIVIAAYFIVVIAVGIWSSKKSSRGSVSGYFLAGHNMHWIPVGASLFASNIGSTHFVGLAGSGAALGIGVALFEINGAFILLLLGWLFVPVYMASGIYTMPEYMQKRFGGQRIRVYLSVLALILYVFTKISADLFAGAMFIEQSLHWNLYLSVILLLSVAAIFTIAGGLSAVIWTDFVQTILMVAGAATLAVKGFHAVGGYDMVVQKFLTLEVSNTSSEDINGTCGKVPQDALHFIRPYDSSDFPWPGSTIGISILATWYWCSDQVIVQRALAAKDLSHAKAGTILAGYLKLLPLYLLVFPGMISRILYSDEIGCTEPEVCQEVCGNPGGCTNIAYPLLVLRLMPTGLSGLMMAVMLAALMSSLTSIFNSSSTIFTIDIWTRIRKNPPDWELLLVGRLFVAVLVVISVAWIPVIQASHGSQLFVYVQSVTSYLAPPVCAIFILAIFWTRTNEAGAFWGLMVGLIVGIVRFGMEFGYQTASCHSAKSEESANALDVLIGRIHFLHFGIILFAITLVVSISVSLLTPAPDKDKIHHLTYWTCFSKEYPPDTKPVTTTSNPDLNGNASTMTNTACDDKCQILNSEKLPDNIQEVLESNWRKAFRYMCCIPAPGHDDNKPECESNTEEIETISYLEEKPIYRRLCNLNASLLIIITLFVCGYYA